MCPSFLAAATAAPLPLPRVSQSCCLGQAGALLKGCAAAWAAVPALFPNTSGHRRQWGSARWNHPSGWICSTLVDLHPLKVYSVGSSTRDSRAHLLLSHLYSSPPKKTASLATSGNTENCKVALCSKRQLWDLCRGDMILLSWARTSLKSIQCKICIDVFTWDDVFLTLNSHQN